MDFVAIDVETANANMASICQIGIAEFRSGVLVDEWTTLVDPEMEFSATNSMIHGIRASHVVGAPTFPLIVGEIHGRLRGKVVVCHTHFDRVAIGQAAERYALRDVDCSWLDSARVARRTWAEFSHSGYGLENLCDHIGYTYNAHDALEDAKAAGMVLLAALRESARSIGDWITHVEGPITPRSQAPWAGQHVRRDGDPAGPLHGAVVVFTGALQMSRQDAADKAARAGCSVADNVSRKTTLLVVGDQDLSKLAGHEKSTKHRKVEELIATGHPVRVIGESEFLDLVSEAAPVAAT